MNDKIHMIEQKSDRIKKVIHSFMYKIAKIIKNFYFF